MNDKDKLLSTNTTPLPSPSIFFMNPQKNTSLPIQPPINTQLINPHANGAPQLQQQILPQYQIGQSTNFVSDPIFNDNPHYHSSQTGNSNMVKSQKPIIFQSSIQKANNQSGNIFQTNFSNQINEQKDYFVPFNYNQYKDDPIESSSLSNQDFLSHKTTPKAEYRELKKKFKFLVYENECYQEELRNLQRKLLKLSRDKNFLLDRLMQYEKFSDSSDDSDSSVKTIEDKSTRPKSVKKSKTVNAPRKKPSSVVPSNFQNIKKSNNLNFLTTPSNKNSKAKVEVTNLSNEGLLKSTALNSNQQNNSMFSQNNNFSNVRRIEKYTSNNQHSPVPSPLTGLLQRKCSSSSLNDAEYNIVQNTLYNKTFSNDFQQFHQFEFMDEDYVIPGNNSKLQYIKDNNNV